MRETIVFRSLPLLLTVAFNVAADGVSYGEPLRKMLVRQLESLPLSDDLSHWLESLRDPHLMMDSDEDVRDGFFDRASYAVAHDWSGEVLGGLQGVLPGLQWSLLVARYSPLVAGANDVKLVYPRAKVEAVKALAESVAGLGPEMLVDVLVVRLFSPRNCSLTFRSLAGSFGMSKSSIERLSAAIAQHLRPQEEMAIASATEFLRNSGFLTA